MANDDRNTMKKQPRPQRSDKNKTPRNRDEFGARFHNAGSSNRPKHRNQMFSMTDD